MNIDHTILTVITFAPLAGAVLLALLPDRGRIMQWGALAVTLVTFVLTLHLPIRYDYSAAPGSFQFDQNVSWISSPAIRYHLGVDGLSMWLVVLTGFLAPLGVLVSWNAIAERKKLFYTLFLLQQVAMLGIFVSLDLFLYYAFWELSLVPMTLLIATFGRTVNRRRAAIKYFLYTFIPSAILLVGMLWVYSRTGTFQLPDLAQLASTHSISSDSAALWLASLAFLVAFAVKVPIFPLHGWLSDAVSEAPTAAVMVLMGKLGLYSILRFSFSIFPEQSRHIAPLMIALGAIGIVYGALIALVQKDLKQLAAYGTLGHVSVVILGIFTFTIAGLDGGIYATINEGIGGGALFMLLGILYERYGTYDMRDYGGLAAKLPWMVTFFVDHDALGHRPADAQRVRRRVPRPHRRDAVHHDAPHALDGARHHRRHPHRVLHALDDPAPLLWRIELQHRRRPRARPRCPRTHCPLAHGRPHASHGRRITPLDARHRPGRHRARRWSRRNRGQPRRSTFRPSSSLQRRPVSKCPPILWPCCPNSSSPSPASSSCSPSRASN